MHCVRGGRGREWAVLSPSVDVQGRQCVQLTMEASWLRQCLGANKRRGQCRLVVRSFIVECLRAFDSHRESLPVPNGDALGSGASQRPKGRKLIMDSDDEAPPASPDPTGFEPSGGRRGPTRKRPGGRRARRGEFLTLMVRDDVTLTFTVGKGRKVYVPLEGRWVSVVIEHLAGKLSQHAGEPGPDFEPRPDFSGLLHKSERPRIGWRTYGKPGTKHHGNWYMRYKGNCGKTRYLGSGFQVPRKDLSGNVYSSSAALKVAQKVLHQVKVHWNKLDMSGQERFDV